ncbi:F-box/FBD/LRR-repeat protein At1g13570-like [Punica granatum]|nr:F-box/FBD/LRR-repeat protein At1g13570-like [Punica granatum]XP_031403564.1 F-box/FBD/LRR-repeat protein At1g13570-like [Punica granatum]XP_031403571.1 F-box/FBD/LRR-repeat protein At1g13570-like [Punica granatum]
MKHREPPKSLCQTQAELDKFSNLPGHVIDQILSQLSIRDAVRTSVLSTKWRYKWTTIPNLVFDNQCLTFTSQDQTVIKNKLVNVIDHVLLLHTGPIYKFKLSHRDLIGITDIDKWILHLSRSPIREFVLEIWKGQRYKLHSSLFSCQDLIHLELFNCLLRPPATFRGFKNLKSLDLQHVTMAQEVFESLISSCPLLERLTLMNFDGFTHLNIDAPRLLFFDVGGYFDDITFTNTFNLALISIGLYADEKVERRSARNSSNLLKFFAHLPNIRRLEIQSYFLKYLAAGDVPGRLLYPCTDLGYLSIRINLDDFAENSAALCLLRSSPNLQELEILARPEEPSSGATCLSFWEGEQKYCKFSQLRLVKIYGVSGIKTELEFIRFVLLASPVLEKMIIKPAPVNEGMEMVKELLRFRRASVQAEIVYVDP